MLLPPPPPPAQTQVTLAIQMPSLEEMWKAVSLLDAAAVQQGRPRLRLLSMAKQGVWDHVISMQMLPPQPPVDAAEQLLLPMRLPQMSPPKPKLHPLPGVVGYPQEA